MEWLSEIKPILGLAFREGGNGLLWMLIGGVAGLVLSLVLIFGLYIFGTKRSWPTKQPWGRWARIILLVYALITVPITAAVAGIGWGLTTAIINVINHEQWIQKASAQGLNSSVAVLYVQLDAAITKKEIAEGDLEDLVSRYVNGEQTIHISALKDHREYIKKGLIREIVEKADQKFEVTDDSLLSRMGTLIAKKVWSWVAEAKIESQLKFVDLIIDRLKDELGKDTVTTKEISFVIGDLFIKPYVDKEMESYQSNAITYGWIQVGVLLVPPIGIVWLVALFQNRFSKRKEED